MKKLLFAASGIFLLVFLLAMTSFAAAAPATKATPTTKRPVTPTPAILPTEPTDNGSGGNLDDAALAPAATPINPGNMTSRIFIFNPDTSGPATVSVQIVNLAGAVVFSTTLTIKANGAKGLALPGSLGTPFRGSALVSSDKNIQAMVTDANSNQQARDLYEGTGSPSTTLTLPLVRHLAANTQKSLIAVQNASNSLSDITLDLFDANGALVASAAATNVPPLASTYFDTNAIFPAGTFTGSGKITANQNVAASEQTLYMKDTASFRGLNSGDSAATLYVTYAERVLNKSGAAVNWTELYVRNNGGGNTDITAQFYSAAGIAVGAPKVAAAVAANGLAQFLTNDAAFADLGKSFKGWVKVTSGGAPLSLYSLESQNAGARLFGMNGLPSTQQGTKFACGDTLRGSAQTSRINVLNVDTTTGNVTIKLYNAGSGAQVASKTVSLTPNKLLTQSLSDASFGGAGSNFEGLAVVTSAGPQIVTSVYTPYINSGTAAGITSYTCGRLQ